MSVNPQLLELCRQGADPAVTRAIHDIRPDDIHKRLPYGVPCDLCPNWMEKMRELAASSFDFEKLKEMGITLIPAEAEDADE